MASKKYLFQTILKALPYYHVMINYLARTILVLSFIVLIFQTSTKYSQKDKYSKLVIKTKWTILIIFVVLEYWFSQLIDIAIIILIGSIFLLCLMIQSSYFKNQRDNFQTDDIFQQLPIQTAFMVQFSKLLFKLLNKTISNLSEDIRETYFENQIIMIKSLFQKINTFPISVNSLKFNLDTDRAPPTFANLEVLQKFSNISQSNKQICDKDITLPIQTINLDQLPSIIKPINESVFSPNQDTYIFQFQEMNKLSIWNQFISDKKQSHQLATESTESLIMLFSCDQMIQLTKKSFEFFRQVLISQSTKKIQIMVKYSPIQKRISSSKYYVRPINDQIIQIYLDTYSRFFRFENKEVMDDFIKNSDN